MIVQSVQLHVHGRRSEPASTLDWQFFEFGTTCNMTNFKHFACTVLLYIRFSDHKQPSGISLTEAHVDAKYVTAPPLCSSRSLFPRQYTLL